MKNELEEKIMEKLARHSEYINDDLWYVDPKRIREAIREAREDERKLCQEEFNMYQRVLAKSNEMQKKYFDK